MKYVIAYDIGTTGIKTCVFKIEESIELIASANRSYPLYTLDNGGAEQEPDDWWKGMIDTTKEIFSNNSNIKPSMIEGLSFCAQMQALVLVDKEGKAVRRSMSYMDQRATEEVKKGISNGIQIAGANIFKLIPSLKITKAVTSSPKDPVWKLKWVESHEPEIFAKAYKWLDVKDYLVCRCTGQFTMTEDSAFATLIYDNRPKKRVFSKKLCKMFKINMDLLPRIVSSTEPIGNGLIEKAAKELGLPVGIKVFGGGGDSSLIGVGGGCTEVGETHVYCGTSGWVNTITDKRKVDAFNMMATTNGVQEGKYNYFAEMETAGKCFEWVKDHLALDEIDIYLQKQHVAEGFEAKYTSLFEYLNETIKSVPAGSNGVVFTPWLHGNRCPFEDPNAVGTFIGIKINTGKTELIRSVQEGVFYHIRWMLEKQNKKVKVSDKIRFVGGGALSEVSCQMLADILGKTVETVKSPQNVGAVGAAALCGVGLGLIESVDQIKKYIPVSKTFEPNMENHKLYEPYYQLFLRIYKTNKKNYQHLNDLDLTPESGQGKIQALKFFLFSTSAGIIQLLVTTILGLINGLPPSAIYLIALVCSVLWNFTFNRKFTFKSANNIPKAMLLAFLFYVPFAPASTLLTAFLTNGDVLGLFNVSCVGIFNSAGVLTSDIPFVATLVATLICMVFNFILEFIWQKYVVFKKPREKQ